MKREKDKEKATCMHLEKCFQETFISCTDSNIFPALALIIPIILHKDVFYNLFSSIETAIKSVLQPLSHTDSCLFSYSSPQVRNNAAYVLTILFSFQLICIPFVVPILVCAFPTLSIESCITFVQAIA